MKLTEFSSQAIKLVIDLLKEKEALAVKISQINRELDAIESGQPKSFAQKGKPSDKPAKRRRYQIKDSVIKELKAAGETGMGVKEIASKLKVPLANVYSWLGTTGKKYKEIQKFERGKYRWVESPIAPAPSTPAPEGGQAAVLP
jgi:DNA invertase Pin-like site-specific DNA recombinase